MNLCISSQQIDQFRTFITIITCLYASRSTYQRHPEVKRNSSLGATPRTLEAFSKPQSKGRERHRDNLRDNIKHVTEMRKAKLGDLEGSLELPSTIRYADASSNEYAVKTRPKIADLNREDMKVLSAYLEDDNKEAMRIDEELRRSFNEVLLKSLQIESTLKRKIWTTKELLNSRGKPKMSSDDLYDDLTRYKQHLVTTQKNLEKVRDLKCTIAP
ncbi:hypothetical protein ACHAQE_006219 [Botrytis cinerea]|uniref:Uncharacterized protein n=1 Tax=Botryotinia fuckeliana (strain BcDW1) TaxID=1290391 RepID=M7U0P1_BOTF1|nr:hypothetical protein BcDW1_4235 [Botrytis cinerea BcDW1]